MSQSAIYDSLQNKFPHYRKGDVLLLHADCMDVMAMVPDKAVDLACVDPPYGIGINGAVGGGGLAKVTQYEKKNWDINPPEKKYFDSLRKISKNQIIWGANHFVSRIPYDSSCWIVWDKINSGNFADVELAFTSFETAARRFSFMWNGMLQGDMKNKELRIHPTQKPIALYKWLYANYAKPNQLIFDSHGGSFSSAIAAHYSGVRFIGCELDEDYYRAAVERFKQATSQVDIFA